ncbi:hypothetical protein U3516DRAFT_654506 [Neocallimastix sp. 'constans']
MNQFKTYYLIDFENVSIRGLEGSEMLTKNDYVHIFSTKHGALITTATLASLNNTNLQVHEVKSRKQSVDMSIATFIGYLIGKNEKNINFVIISNDHDFDSVREFWKLKKNLIIKRQNQTSNNNIYEQSQQNQMYNNNIYEQYQQHFYVYDKNSYEQLQNMQMYNSNSNYYEGQPIQINYNNNNNNNDSDINKINKYEPMVFYNNSNNSSQ